MNPHEDHAFRRLLAAWRRREDARSGDLGDLANARFELDRARAAMRSTSTSIR